MESYELFSCFCLFDECCLSKYKRESYQELVNRIVLFEKKMCWLIRKITHTDRPEKRYVCCINHARRIMENLVLTETQRENLREGCLRIVDNQPSVGDKRRSCFYFYCEDLIELHEFYISCKLYFISSDYFNLKKKELAM